MVVKGENCEQHAQLTRLPPVNGIIGEFKNQARLVLSWGSQYSERVNRIRQQYLNVVVPTQNLVAKKKPDALF